MRWVRRFLKFVGWTIAFILLVGFFAWAGGAIQIDFKPRTPPPGTRIIAYRVPQIGARIHSIARGDPQGQRIIFIHGTPGDGLGWRHYFETVRPGIELVAIDRPGFGESLPDRAVPSLAQQARAIAPLLVKRNGRWPILVGHSLGGPIIAQVALDNPGKVEALLILAGSFDPAQEEIYRIQNIGEWRGIRWMVPAILRNTNEELLALKPQLVLMAPRLASLRCRVTIIQGTMDTNVPYANLPFLRAHLADAEQVTPITLKGRDHFIPWTEQALVNRAIDDLLRGRSRSC